MKLKRTVWGDYQYLENGKVRYTVGQNYDNRTWNIYEGDDILMGWLDTTDTLREAREWIKNSVGRS